MTGLVPFSTITGAAASSPMSLAVLLAELKICSSLRDFERGRSLHGLAVEAQLDSNVYVSNILIDLYAKCDKLVDARDVFDKMEITTVVSWNSMILGYAEAGLGEEALRLFASMSFEDSLPNARTFCALVKACTRMASKTADRPGWLGKGMAVHAQAVHADYEDIYLACAVVNMYAKYSSMVQSRMVFETVHYRDVVSWTTLISGYAENGKEDMALELFASMHLEGCSPNSLTFVAVLKACSGIDVNGLEKTMAVHSQAAKFNQESDALVVNMLVDVYAKSGSIQCASKVFHAIHFPDVISWTSLITGYAENGESHVALELFACMEPESNVRTFLAALRACCLDDKQKPKPEEVLAKLMLQNCTAIHSRAASLRCDSDYFVANTLVHVYSTFGKTIQARRVFDGMESRDTVVYTTLMLGYAGNEQGRESLQLFFLMQQEGCLPDSMAFVAALKACGTLAALEIGRDIHSHIRSRGLDTDLVVATSLVDFYGKCGNLVDAQRIFDSMEKTRNLTTWTALIAGYSRCGDTCRVLELFDQMIDQGFKPDGVTFLCVLSACSHSGLVDKGLKYFETMKSKYGIVPEVEHYDCMLDILSRANELDQDSAEMIKKMPFKADAVTLTTVLKSLRA